ncbi:hypothetical protein FPCIR_12330 [Fusarium pseudocircinatum]|uniref:Uncharacterized protein n=1 Tax=Fusarium pseudocircinatum TaxID=56676 RepID=A0A8H5KR27_9HYPO|nr:hypothetical protein FPCIR_12330 [Fusarium pseudocircinatum]
MGNEDFSSLACFMSFNEPYKAVDSHCSSTKLRQHVGSTSLESDFLDEQKDVFGALFATFPVARRLFENRSFLVDSGERIARRPIADEKMLGKFLHETVEDPVRAVIEELKQVEDARHIFDLGNVNRKTISTVDTKARSQHNAEKLTAAAVTQTYHYMIESGLQHGVLTTGEAFVFFKIDWNSPQKLQYHLAEPIPEVQAHPENAHLCAAVDQYLAFTLTALGSPGDRHGHGQEERPLHDAIAGENGYSNGRVRHPVSYQEWLERLEEQLACSLDDGITLLGMDGARGVLFQITLLDYGYTFVGKGTVLAFISGLQHEAAVYERSAPCQGKNIPVFLGAIDLRSMDKTYYYTHRVCVPEQGDGTRIRSRASKRPRHVEVCVWGIKREKSTYLCSHPPPRVLQIMEIHPHFVHVTQTNLDSLPAPSGKHDSDSLLDLGVVQNDHFRSSLDRIDHFSFTTRTYYRLLWEE